MDRREHIEPVMTSDHTFLLDFKCSYSWDSCISRWDCKGSKKQERLKQTTGVPEIFWHLCLNYASKGHEKELKFT